MKFSPDQVKGLNRITDIEGRVHLVDAGGIRYFTWVDDVPTWEIAISAGNVAAWFCLAEQILNTPGEYWQ